MLVHKFIMTGHKSLHRRFHQMLHKCIDLLLGPLQIRLTVTFCQFIGRIADDLRCHAHPVHGNSRMDAGIIEVFIGIRVHISPCPENSNRIFPVHIIPCNIIENCLCICSQSVRDKFAVGALGIIHCTGRIRQFDARRS